MTVVLNQLQEVIYICEVVTTKLLLWLIKCTYFYLYRERERELASDFFLFVINQLII